MHESILGRMRGVGAAAAIAALGMWCSVASAADQPTKEPPPPKVASPRVAPPKVTPPPKVEPVRAAPARVAPVRAAPPPKAPPAPRRPAVPNPRGARLPAPGGKGEPGAGSGPVPSTAFAGRPGPAGSSEIRAANGTVLRQRADGSVRDVHDARRGLEIQRGLNGERRIVVDRPDQSRVVVERGRDGYVQQRYVFGGHEFAHRSYWVNGQLYDRFYRRYPAPGGGFWEVYAPARYYPAGFYGWTYRRWGRPVPYAWGWAATPWYGHYGYYFAASTVYVGATFWLTDYLMARSLQAAYAAGPPPPAPPAPPDAAPALTPELKQRIAEEVQRQVAQESAEAQANQQRPGAEPAAGGIVPLLSDNRAHVFVAGAELDLVDPTGRECMLSQGDVVQVVGVPAGTAASANAVVLASKGGNECAPAVSVEIALAALQEMQNHMRETLDQGMAELQAKQGQGGLPPAPAGLSTAPQPAPFAAAAPPPDAHAGVDIAQQTQAADQAEQSLTASVPREAAGTRDLKAAAPGTDPGSAPVQISLGQSIEAVTALLGAPTRIVDLGAKKIYSYPDMKVIFTNGQVSDVQ